MRKPTSSKSKKVPSISQADCVGTAEFRGNLAKYLKQAKLGRPVVIQERGRRAFLLTLVEEDAPRSVFGCMRARTEYMAGTIVNAAESWSTGVMP